MSSPRTPKYKFSIELLFLFFIVVRSQYQQGSETYTLTYDKVLGDLDSQLREHEDVVLKFDPSRAQIFSNNYIFQYPLKTDYRIGIMMDPCRYNAFNCCMNHYGEPQYASLIQSGLEAERVFRFPVIASEDEVNSNYILIDEDSKVLPPGVFRNAADDELIDPSCESLRVPYGYCLGRNYRKKRAKARPYCMDYNETLNSMSSCFDPHTEEEMPNCVQVAYTSTAFIPQCIDNEDAHCGTFLEIHMAHGNPYFSDENSIIAESRITTNYVSGYYTTTIPLTFMKNPRKVLCSYSEFMFRVNSLVYIKNTAPKCCCPKNFDPDSRVGKWMCPTGATGNGEFARGSLSLADKISVDALLLDYPFCPVDLTYNEDRMICSVWNTDDRRHYTQPCATVDYDNDANRGIPGLKSSDMDGTYQQVFSIPAIKLITGEHWKCPYFSSCALVADATERCIDRDELRTFQGYVGLVTEVIEELNQIPLVKISFNGGRTSYTFNQADVKLESMSKTQYEMWWVLRTPSEFIVQHKKAFKISSPVCTFDKVFDRYFPYAILDGNGEPMKASASPEPE